MGTVSALVSRASRTALSAAWQAPMGHVGRLHDLERAVRRLARSSSARGASSKNASGSLDAIVGLRGPRGRPEPGAALWPGVTRPSSLPVGAASHSWRASGCSLLRVRPWRPPPRHPGSSCRGVRSRATRTLPELISDLFRAGKPPPLYVPVALTDAEACSALNQWHSGAFLAPESIGTSSADPAFAVTLSYLPFRCYDLEASVRWRSVTSRRQGTTWDVQEGPWHDVGERRWGWEEPSMQVYASCRYRRDLARAAPVPRAARSAYPLPASAVQAKGGVGGDAQRGAGAAGGYADGWGGLGLNQGGAEEGDYGQTRLGGASASAGGGGRARADGEHPAAGEGTDGINSRPSPLRDSSTGRPSHVPPASGGSGVSFGAVALDLPDLSPGITFELMTRGLVAELRREFGEGQKRDAAEGTVVEVEVQLSPLSHSSRLVFFPAYHVNYSVGTSTNAAGEKVPDEYEAMVGAASGAGVVSERHVSGPKAAALATGASSLGFAALGMLSGGTGIGEGIAVGAGAGAGAAADAVGGALSGVATPEFAVFTVVAGALARMAAQAVTRERRRREEEERVRLENDAIQRFTYGSELYIRARGQSGPTLAAGYSPETDAGSRVIERNEEHEWRRWAEADRWNWVPQDRCRWAESIYRQQKHRRLSRERFLRRLGEEVARLEREAASESARRERYGPSHYDRIGARLGGGGGGGDAMGYYRILGLSDLGSRASQDQVKSAYRAAVMSCHPDRAGAGAATSDLLDKFVQVQAAYEVLRDPQRREAYDQGTWAPPPG